MAKIGFCCKWIDTSGIDPKASRLLTEQMNQKTTTQKYMASLSRPDQFIKIKALVRHNTETLWRQLRWIATQPEGMRLFRITSEFLPLYTVPTYAWIYAHYDIEELITEGLRGVRKYADANNIRLCSHPGQFTNLCSDKPHVVAASIIDFEYHAMLAEKMGYGDTWHSSGFAINIHANVRQDPGLKNIRRIIANDLSDVARNLITLENDEYSCDVDDFVDNGVHEDVALVLDLHHTWIASKGWYMGTSGTIPEAFRSSWRGIRPLGHMSMPQKEVIPVTPTSHIDEPDYAKLVALPGVSSSTLRAHSYDMWNHKLMTRALSHSKYMDIEVEAKGKNVASRQLYDKGVALGYI